MRQSTLLAGPRGCKCEQRLIERHATAALFLLVTSAFLFPRIVSAQGTVFDEEPNDTPQEAIEVAGAAVLTGSMDGGDQDAYRWTVSDEDAAKSWTLELQGIPGRLTVLEVIRLTYDDAGNISATDPLLKVASRDGTLPVVVADLVFEEGEYILGLAQAGGSSMYRPPTAAASFLGDETGTAAETTEEPGGYRVRLTDNPALASTYEPNFERDAADIVRPGAGSGAFLLDDSPVWYRIEIPEAEAALRWDVGIHVPVGREVQAILTDAEGARLGNGAGNQQGKLEFRDLALAAGSYYLQVTPSIGAAERSGHLLYVTATQVGQRIEGDEAEPNNYWNQANAIDSAECCSGRIAQSGDADLFRFEVDADGTETTRRISLTSAAPTSFRVCLLDQQGIDIQCRTGAGTIDLGNLLLPPGTYGVAVRQGAEGDEYRFSIVDDNPPTPGQETEPNDLFAYATSTPESSRIRGSFDSATDIDFYRFVVTDEPQLWRFQVMGDKLARVYYHDASGAPAQTLIVGAGQRRARLENMFLMPGVHHLSLHGLGPSDYTILARALGPPDPNGELEPNDDESRMQPLRIGQTRTGLLADPADKDMYRIYINGEDHVRITATPPADGLLQASLDYNGDKVKDALRTDGPIVLDGVLPPGDYYLTLSPRQVSDAEYTVSLERLDRFTCEQDCEPNDAPAFASPFPRSGRVEGHAGDWRDVDWYQLPTSSSERTVRIALESDVYNSIDVFDAQGAKLEFVAEPGTKIFAGVLPADQRGYLKVGLQDSPADYAISLLPIEESVATAMSLPVELSLTLDTTTVSAYERSGQQLSGRLQLRNIGTNPLSLIVDASATDSRWLVEPEKHDLVLAAGAAETVNVTVVAAADAWADIPVRIGVRARAAEDDRFVSAYVDVAVDRDAVPVNPVHAFNVPEPLQGGIDVARSDFGATISSTPEAGYPADANLLELVDGIVAMFSGPTFVSHDGGPLTITVDLPGDQPVPIAGFGVNPLTQTSLQRTPKQVKYQLSLDGVHYETVAIDDLVTVGVDQFVALEEPQPAKFARLVTHSNWFWAQTANNSYSLGSWKVVAEPGFNPFSARGPNLADKSLGGHVVWSSPQLDSGRDLALLTEASSNRAARVAPQQEFDWVIAFHDNRAAKITAIDWTESTVNPPNRSIDEMILSVSIDSPAGPWTPVAEWSRRDGGTAIKLSEPVWARFVRFSVPPTDEDRWLVTPGSIGIYEQLIDSSYRSVLGEWGHRNPQSFYETTQPVARRPARVSRPNSSRGKATALPPQTFESGFVRLGGESHWYRPAIPAGHNTLTFTLSGDPTVRTELEVSGANGNRFPLRKLESDSDSRVHVFTADVPTGETVFAEVREPPRNIMFLWDTSPSVNPYLPMIYNSLAAYAEDLVPGQDAANLLPFGSPAALLKDWYGEPYLMQTILNDYPRRESSSDAERTQATATRLLGPRPGSKAIVVITDAATPRDAQVWDAFREVQPRVFIMKIASDEVTPINSEIEQDISQDWAHVNGGHYSYLANEGEMEVAFDRASTLLRRPADYALSFTSEYREAPGPGLLRVISAAGVSSAGAVELILDASGSMWQKLDGRFRIAIAKEVLSAALQDHVPSGTPTALRVFGHRQPNVCDGNLEIPLQPLDSAAAVTTINGITPQSLAKTPIAASLAAVQQDLAGQEGPAVVVLVTDGKETCGGDPAAEIEKLKAAGIGLSLNIVGFAIDDESLEAQFAAWARDGGGAYFGADDAEALQEAVVKSLAVPYAVYDRNNNEVARGTVGGEPIELEQGIYKVVVETSPRRDFDDVQVTGAGETRLEL